MNAVLAGTRLEIRSAREARAGSELDVVLDIELPEPWLEKPRLGKEVPSVDGRGSRPLTISFECEKGTAVPALVTGTAVTRDTRIDVHSGEGFPDAGAGRGHEVALVAPGGLTVIYGHLARGTSKAGFLHAGATIGQSGNTGRCVDGCGRSFVAIAIEGTKTARTLDDVFAPLEVEVLLDGKPQARTKLPAGETRLPSFRAGRVRVPRDAGKGALALEVRLERRRSVLASLREDIKVHV